MASSSSDQSFLPTATWEMLQFRSRLMQRLRSFFADRGFVEVETPLLSRDAVVDIHIDPIPVSLFADPRAPDCGRRMWLQTSPEFGMKRLLATGADRIFQITKAFRAGEQGAYHNPEFTIVEWYRIGDDLQRGIELLANLARSLIGADRVELISYEQAFLQHVGVNAHRATAAELARRATALQLNPPAALNDRDSWLNFLLHSCVEPHLGATCPTILFDYPASQAALARTRRLTDDSNCEVAERFELYWCGVELANGYHELLDPDILRRRNRLGNERRIADGRYEVPEQSRLLDAMEHGLPACSGVALGFDRLVMVLSGAKEIQQVIPFPIDRA